jgi:VWFA-related protein
MLARNLVRRFVTEHLGPNDVAAIVLTGRGLASSGQDFTSNRSLLLKAIDKFTGGFEPSTANVEIRPGAGTGDAGQQEDNQTTPAAEETQWTFQGPGGDKAFSSDARQLASSLRKLTEFMGALPGRKTLLYVGEGLGGLDFFDVVDYHGGALTPAAIDAHAAVAAATRGNVTIYPVDPRGLTTDLTPAAITGEIVGSQALETRADVAALADVTGGFPITNSNSVETAFDRVVTENSSYYTLGFDSGYSRRDGRFVGVEVRVRRPGLSVRSRNGYVAPLGEERKPARADTDSRLRAVADALATPIATRGIPVRVFAAPFKGTRKKAAVALAIEIDASAVGGQGSGGTRTSDLEISYFATNDRGTVIPGHRHRATLSRSERATGGAWVRVLSQIELEAGRYQLRVAAGTAFNAGSVVYDLEVPNFTREPLMMSVVAVTSPASGAIPTERPQDPLGAALPTPPTASRDFTSGETISLFAEVYDNREGQRNQTPPAIEVTASLLNERDRVVRFARADPVPASKSGRTSGGHGFATSLAMDVPPGTYVLSVETRSGDASAHRRIPLRVR